MRLSQSASQSAMSPSQVDDSSLGEQDQDLHASAEPRPPFSRDLSAAEYTCACRLLAEYVSHEVMECHSFTGLASHLVQEFHQTCPQGPETAHLVALAVGRDTGITKRPNGMMLKLGRKLDPSMRGISALQLYAHCVLGQLFDVSRNTHRALTQADVVKHIHAQTEAAIPLLYTLDRFVGCADPVVPLSLAAAEYRLSSNPGYFDRHASFLRAMGHFGNYAASRLEQVFHPHGPRLIGGMERQHLRDPTQMVPIHLVYESDAGPDSTASEADSAAPKKPR